jgi:hypothetical protein
MAALNSNGQQINIGDQVSIQATVVSTAPFGSTVPSGLATVTSGTALTPATFTHNGNDAAAVQHSIDSAHVALSDTGKAYGAAGDFCTPKGTVTAISGSGDTASVSVKLITSGATVVVPAGVCNSASAGGGTQ